MRAMHDMPALNLYDAISDAGSNAEMRAAAVISGDNAGEKALILDGVMSWNSEDSGFLRAHEAEIAGAADNGIIEIDGQEIFTELFGSEKQIIICGAGHVAMPIITITRMMGMKVTVIDDREELIENAKRRGADRTICSSFAEAMKEIEGSEDTFFVIVTRGHRYDKDCVGAALQKKHAYVGMIGSRRHAAFVKQSLLKEGLPEDLIDTIYTPIGLSIGAETPEEIAVAIAAEIIEVKNRKRRNSGYSREMLKEILSDERDPIILATIIRREGSAPRGIGTKMLVRKDGSILETIGGGSAEAEIIKHSKQLLEGGFSGAEIRHQDFRTSAEEDGMVCGGTVDVLLETV